MNSIYHATSDWLKGSTVYSVCQYQVTYEQEEELFEIHFCVFLVCYWKIQLNTNIIIPGYREMQLPIFNVSKNESYNSRAHLIFVKGL